MIDQVTERDGSIAVDGDDLRIRAPAGRLDEDLQNALKFGTAQPESLQFEGFVTCG